MTNNDVQPLYISDLDLMDQQHKEMFDLLDEIKRSLDADATQKVLLLMCNQLVNALRQHYDDEERLMLKYFYPDTEAHIGLHMNYLSTVGKLIQCINDRQCTDVFNTLDYMKRWQSDHINDADKKYADFINDKSA